MVVMNMFVCVRSWISLNWSLKTGPWSTERTSADGGQATRRRKLHDGKDLHDLVKSAFLLWCSFWDSFYRAIDLWITLYMTGYSFAHSEFTACPANKLC